MYRIGRLKEDRTGLPPYFPGFHRGMPFYSGTCLLEQDNNMVQGPVQVGSVDAFDQCTVGKHHLAPPLSASMRYFGQLCGTIG